jgi:hypothetical protein
MTINIIKDPYCDQIRTKKLIQKFCKDNDLYFRDSHTYYFSFSIVKLIPYTNTGFFYRMINGKYIHKYICNGNITENDVVRIFFQPVDFQPGGTYDIMKMILLYMKDSEFNVEIRYPCEYYVDLII